jgi:hypothetical protein
MLSCMWGCCCVGVLLNVIMHVVMLAPACTRGPCYPPHVRHGTTVQVNTADTSTVSDKATMTHAWPRSNEGQH